MTFCVILHNIIKNSDTLNSKPTCQHFSTKIKMLLHNRLNANDFALVKL